VRFPLFCLSSHSQVLLRGQRRAVAGRIGDRGMREQAFRNIAKLWLYWDTPAAETWLANTPELTPETKAALLRNRHEWRADYGN
jgi:hypothetical protein